MFEKSHLIVSTCYWFDLCTTLHARIDHFVHFHYAQRKLRGIAGCFSLKFAYLTNSFCTNSKENFDLFSFCSLSTFHDLSHLHLLWIPKLGPFLRIIQKYTNINIYNELVKKRSIFLSLRVFISLKKSTDRQTKHWRFKTMTPRDTCMSVLLLGIRLVYDQVKVELQKLDFFQRKSLNLRFEVSLYGSYYKWNVGLNTVLHIKFKSKENSIIQPTPFFIQVKIPTH